jgi:hypothetical protein
MTTIAGGSSNLNNWDVVQTVSTKRHLDGDSVALGETHMIRPGPNSSETGWGVMHNSVVVVNPGYCFRLGQVIAKILKTIFEVFKKLCKSREPQLPEGLRQMEIGENLLLPTGVIERDRCINDLGLYRASKHSYRQHVDEHHWEFNHVQPSVYFIQYKDGNSYFLQRTSMNATQWINATRRHL